MQYKGVKQCGGLGGGGWKGGWCYLSNATVWASSSASACTTTAIPVAGGPSATQTRGTRRRSGTVDRPRLPGTCRAAAAPAPGLCARWAPGYWTWVCPLPCPCAIPPSSAAPSLCLVCLGPVLRAPRARGAQGPFGPAHGQAPYVQFPHASQTFAAAHPEFVHKCKAWQVLSGPGPPLTTVVSA